MPKKYQLTPELLRHAHVVALPALSAIVQDLPGEADLYVLENRRTLSFAITLLEVRWISESAFSAPQPIAIKGYKLESIATFPTDEGKECAAHYVNPDDPSQAAIPTTDLRAYITTGGALWGGVWNPGELNAPDPEDPPFELPEPIFFAMGGGSTLPSLYDDVLGISAGAPRVLRPSGGLLIRLHTAIASPGSGSLFVGLHGLWLPS